MQCTDRNNLLIFLPQPVTVINVISVLLSMQRLKEENMKISQEKEELVSQIVLQREKWDKEKVT